MFYANDYILYIIQYTSTYKPLNFIVCKVTILPLQDNPKGQVTTQRRQLVLLGITERIIFLSY